jgi:hypothetical protein
VNVKLSTIVVGNLGLEIGKRVDLRLFLAPVKLSAALPILEMHIEVIIPIILFFPVLLRINNPLTTDTKPPMTSIVLQILVCFFRDRAKPKQSVEILYFLIFDMKLERCWLLHCTRWYASEGL